MNAVKSENYVKINAILDALYNGIKPRINKRDVDDEHVIKAFCACRKCITRDMRKFSYEDELYTYYDYSVRRSRDKTKEYRESNRSKPEAKEEYKYSFTVILLIDLLFKIIYGVVDGEEIDVENYVYRITTLTQAVRCAATFL